MLKLSKILLYETSYDKLQPYFGEENLELHYMDADGFELSVNAKDNIKDLKNLEDLSDFSNINEDHELFCIKNKKVVGKFEIEFHKCICFEKFFCLRNKMYAFKCENDSKNKLKGISKSSSKRANIEEYYNCFFGREFQKECDNYISRSLNLEMHLQRVKKSTLSFFDDKRCYIKEKKLKVNLGINTLKWL